MPKIRTLSFDATDKNLAYNIYKMAMKIIVKRKVEEGDTLEEDFARMCFLSLQLAFVTLGSIENDKDFAAAFNGLETETKEHLKELGIKIASGTDKEETARDVEDAILSRHLKMNNSEH
jgi:hypothetical protein